MRKVKHTAEQIKELKHNKYVQNCTSKHIVFTKECKIQVVKLSEKYTPPREIFKILWFPNYVIDSATPNSCIMRWKRNLKTKWTIEESKWQKKKEIFDISKMSKDEELEYLRHKVALFEELNNLTNDSYP